MVFLRKPLNYDSACMFVLGGSCERWIQTGMEISEMTGDIEKIMYVMTGSSQYIAQSLKAFENKDRKALRPAGEKNKKN